MAERRMFSKSVVESDPFMDMPAEAQALYFHLNMAADDDGFCDNPRSIMRACGASNDTMKLLIAKKFVLTFEKNDGFLVVVKHWRLNNYIRKDTYHETKYKEFMRELYFDENQSYSMNPGDGHALSVLRSHAVQWPSIARYHFRFAQQSYGDPGSYSGVSASPDSDSFHAGRKAANQLPLVATRMMLNSSL